MVKNRHQKKEIKKSKFTKANIISILIIVLMISSVAGFVANYESSSTIKIKGYKFSFDEQNRVWTAKINGEKMFFYNTPDTVNDFPEDFKNQFRELKFLAITRELNNSLDSTISALQFELATYLPAKIVGGYTTNETKFPKITCDDLSTVYVIVGNESKVEEDKCLKLFVSSVYDVANYRDSLIYAYYGII